MAAAVKLEYFDIMGIAEKVRLALTVSGVPFEDIRIPFADWPARKATTKYGQLPCLTLSDGTQVWQSDAMLRWAGSQDPSDKLYPASPAMHRLKIDEVLGLCADLDREWRPCLYLGMKPEKFGHAGIEDAAKDALLKDLRETFLKDEFPKYLGFFEQWLDASGDTFLCGNDLTIADMQATPQLYYFTMGVASHVPADCLAKASPRVVAYVTRVMEHPKVAAYYAQKASKP